jgi:hypothetical protein
VRDEFEQVLPLERIASGQNHVGLGVRKRRDAIQDRTPLGQRELVGITRRRSFCTAMSARQCA